MKKTYKANFDCANCANQAARAITKLDGVASADVNFMFGKMTVDYEENVDEKNLFKKIIKTCKRVEPDCEIE
ncbi:MAG: heavy metal-associated domain-containing protein [Clostridia bacterium]|nr:heavy metal-associated domain-containing protein [Clostridia bacterium]